MKKITKLFSLGILCLAAMCLSVYFAFSPVKANAENTEKPDFAVAKSSIRIANDANGNGIRFAVVMKNASFEQYAQEGNEMGALLLPADLVETELTLDSVATANAQQLVTFGASQSETEENVIASRWVDCNISGYEDYKMSIVYLYGIPEGSYNRPITVRGYVKLAGGDEIYSNPMTKSLAEEALAEYNDTQNQTVLQYVKDYKVKFLNSDGSVLQENTLQFGSTFTVPNVTVDDDHYFDGWKVQKGVDESSNPVFGDVSEITDKTVKYSVTYKAEVKKYLSVTFLDVDGSLIETKKVKDGAIIPHTSVPDREKLNHVQNGWEKQQADGSFIHFGNSYEIERNAITEDVVYKANYNIMVSSSYFNENKAVEVDFNDGNLYTSGYYFDSEYVQEDDGRYLHISRSEGKEVLGVTVRSFDGLFTSGESYEVKIVVKSGVISGGSQFLICRNEIGNSIETLRLQTELDKRNSQNTVTAYYVQFTATTHYFFELYVTNMDCYINSVIVRKIDNATEEQISQEGGYTVRANQMVYTLANYAAVTQDIANGTINFSQTGAAGNFAIKSFANILSDAEALYTMTFTFAEPISGNIVGLRMGADNNQSISGGVDITKVSNTVYQAAFDGNALINYIVIYGTSNAKFKLKSVNVYKTSTPTWTVLGKDLTLSGGVNNANSKQWETVTVSDDNPVSGVANGTYCRVVFNGASNCYFNELNSMLQAGYTYKIEVKGYAIQNGALWLGTFETDTGDSLGSQINPTVNESGVATWTRESVTAGTNAKYFGFYSNSGTREIYIESVTITRIAKTANA